MSRHSTLGLGLGLALLIAACGGGDAGDGDGVSSPDGLLTVTGGGDIAITVSEGDVDDLPDDVAGVLIGGVYELGPDGATFDDPVTVTFEADVAPGTVPALFVYDGTGFEALGNATVERGPDGVLVSGELDHFSTVVALGLDMELTFSPDAVTLAVGESFTATATVTVESDPDIEITVSEDSFGTSTPDILAVGAQAPGFEGQTAPFTCIDDGTGVYFYTARIRVVGDIITVFGGPLPFPFPEIHTWHDSVAGAAQCVPPFEPPATTADGVATTGPATTSPATTAPTTAPPTTSGTETTREGTAPIDGGHVEYRVPDPVTTGTTIQIRICVRIDGAAGREWFLSFGNDLQSAMADHDFGTLDADGCITFTIDVNWPAGTIQKLVTSDGSKVYDVTVIQVVG